MADVLTFSNKATINTTAKVKLKKFYFHAFANALTLYAIHLDMSYFQNFSLVLFFVTIISAGCKEKAVNPLQPIGFTDTAKEFKREIPTFDDGKLDFFYISAKEKQKQLGLDSLENGYENLQIRLWYDSSRTLGRKLIVLTNRDTSWIARVYQMKVLYDGKAETITSVSETQIVPRSGWTAFSRKLRCTGFNGQWSCLG